jgi:hypothetical protein
MYRKCMTKALISILDLQIYIFIQINNKKNLHENLKIHTFRQN